MVEKLSFSIENFDIIKEDPNSQFATARVQAFASGSNLHNLECSEETLKKTAQTIYHKPILYTINKWLMDFNSHSKPEDSLIAGFVYPNSGEFIKLEDGRLGLSVIIKLFKRYVPKVMDILKRDKNKKISVEMDLIEAEERPDGIREMLDFVYSGICLLGDSVREASPGANIQMMSFSKENELYEEAYKMEFTSRYSDVNFAIPSVVKSNAQMGLDLSKQYGIGSTSVNLATARHIVKSENSTPEKVRHIAKTLKGKKFENIMKDPPNAEYVAYMLYGGGESKTWSHNLSRELDALDEKHLAFFSEDESKKKEEKLVDDELEKKEDMAVETPKEEAKEDPKEEATETKDEEKQEDKKEEMSLDSNLDLVAVLAMLANETEDYKTLAQDFSDEGTKNYAKLAYAMYGKMMEMKADCEKMSAEKEEMCGKFAEADEKNKAYMAENEELKKFKADVEANRFNAEVGFALKEIEESVVIPKSEIEALFEESKKFSLETIDAFKNLAKARAFNFAVKGKKEDEPKRYALPFVLNDNSKKGSSPWVR